MSNLRDRSELEAELAAATGSRRHWLLAELSWELRGEDPPRAAALAAEALEPSAGDADETRCLAAGRAHCTLAALAGTRGDFDDCERHARAALASTPAQLDTLTHGTCVALLAGSLHVHGRQEEARALLLEALAAISPDDRPGRLARLTLLNELGRCSFALCEWADAHEYFARGLDLAHREGDQRLEGVLNVNLGNVLSELQETEGCLEHYREALQIHRLRADADGQSLALHNLAVVHARIGDVAESERCAREAIRLVEDSGHWTNRQTGLLLAERLAERSELAEAREWIETALADARRAGSAPATVKALSSLAAVERQAGDTARAKELLDSAVGELKDVDDLSPSLQVSVELARVHEAAGRFDDARRVAEKAVAQARAIDGGPVLAEALEILERCHELSGHHAGALAARRERHEAEVQALRRAADGRSEVLRTRHELDRALQRERDLELQRGELEREVADRTEALSRANEDLQAALREKQRTEGEREQLADQLRRAQKMEAVGRLAGGIAHDFNNLLTVLRGHAELLVDDLPPGGDNHESARHLVDACDRAARLTSQLMAFSRHRPREHQVLDANRFLDDLQELVQRLIGEDVVLELNLAEAPACIEMDPGCLEQVLFNLAVNARDAMPSGGRLTMSTGRRAFDSPLQARTDHVVISVTDTGAGIDPQTLELIFEPFFTTKAVGEGTGLGLATSYGLIRQAGGTILVTSTEGTGSTFEILLPASASRAPTASAAHAGPAPVEAPTRRVLLVEDEPSVRRLLESGLESFGHEVSCAGDGLEALELIDGEERPFDVIVSDVVMPRMGGPELLSRLLEREVGPPVVLTSGWPDRAGAPPGRAGTDYVFLEKPFRLAKLSEAIESLFA